jgi:hypothetical protein
VSSILAPLALTASTSALLALPLAPALRELKSKRDAVPLATRKDDGCIANFAASLRSYCNKLQVLLFPNGYPEENSLLTAGQSKVFVIVRQFPLESHISDFVLCLNPIQLPDDFHSTGDFYSFTSIETGEGNVFRTLMSESDVQIGNASKSLRWTHAESRLIVGEGCALFGRASANQSITLSNDCTFERIHAPVIYTSDEASRLRLRVESEVFSKLARSGIGRKRVHGKARFLAGQQHRGDLVSTKGLQMDKQSSVLGSVKANGEVRLGACTTVDGSLVSTKAIHIEAGSFVKGPIISEHEIRIGSGVQIGIPGIPTTVSAPKIYLAPGSVLHGTVWARVEGRVGV